MAKHQKSGRRSKKFFAYPIENSLALITLANGVALAGNLTALGVTKAYCISADLSWSIDDLTPGEGPLEVGLSTSDLTVTEIIEKLDAKPTSQSDIIAIERSRRPVRNSGRFSGQPANESLNDGLAIRTPLRFVLAEGKELVMWVRNKSGANLTTGAVVRVVGTLYMKWI